MIVIWKFQLSDVSEQLIEIPKDATILTAQTQNGILCLWAEVDKSLPTVERKIRIYDTGERLLSKKESYVGTCQRDNGKLVSHVYDCG